MSTGDIECRQASQASQGPGRAMLTASAKLKPCENPLWNACGNVTVQGVVSSEQTVVSTHTDELPWSLFDAVHRNLNTRHV